MITELYTVYRPELLRFCCMMCGNVSDAEDLLQVNTSQQTGHLGRTD